MIYFLPYTHVRTRTHTHTHTYTHKLKEEHQVRPVETLFINNYYSQAKHASVHVSLCALLSCLPAAWRLTFKAQLLGYTLSGKRPICMSSDQAVELEKHEEDKYLKMTVRSHEIHFKKTWRQTI
jgi:uncharacterized cupin superfamily protein